MHSNPNHQHPQSSFITLTNKSLLLNYSLILYVLILYQLTQNKVSTKNPLQNRIYLRTEQETFLQILCCCSKQPTKCNSIALLVSSFTNISSYTSKISNIAHISVIIETKHAIDTLFTHPLHLLTYTPVPKLNYQPKFNFT